MLQLLYFANNNQTTQNNPCRYCTPETGRSPYCRDTCEEYLRQHPKIATAIKPQKSLEDICGNFMGYLVHPSGRVISKNRHKFLDVDYRNGVPFVTLSENNITYTYRLDQVVFRSFDCTYKINSRTVLHKDGDKCNCKIKNLCI